MNQEETLATLKKDVRSLLISSNTGLDPDGLRRDYFNMLGYPMPLKQLGFRNILDMVKEMPDMVSIHFQAHGNILLKAVGDNTTRNLQELVANQRCTKKKKMVYSRSPNMFSNRYYQTPSSVPLFRRCGPPPSLPANLRAQLRILLSQGPIRTSDLQTSYVRCFGQPLRVYSYGFYSIGEMLIAAADMILVHQGRHGSVLSLRPHMLPRSVFTPFTPKRMPELIEPGIPVDKPIISEPNAKMQKNCLVGHSISNGSCTEKTRNPVISESTFNRHPEMIDKCQKAEALPQHEDIDLNQHIFKLQEELRQQIVENGVAGTIGQELKNKLLQVVGQTTGGLSVHELPSAYQRLFGEELPLVQNGFVSTIELVGAMNDVFHLKPSDSGQDWTIINAQNNAQIDLQERRDPNSSDKTDMSSHYLITGASPWEKQQESSVDDLDSSDDSDLDQHDELETNHMQINTEITEQYNAIQVHCSPTVPLDALQCQRLKPPARRPARELVDVLVERVESPGNFYVRLSETEEARALAIMMIEMRRCYKCPKVSERYRLPEQYIRQGQVCSVSPRGMWFYRAVIHKIIKPTEVEVYFVDYGVIAVVKSASLKFLKSIYSTLPAQAIPSSLAGIAPTTGNWTAEATASFQKLCSDRTLVGALECYIGDVLQLYLCDTHTKNDIYIHSVLLSQGHGMACGPAVSAEVTPVSLYLGTNMIDLPEVHQTLTSSFQPADALQSSIGSKPEDDEDDMPSLESINELNPFSLFQGRSFFNAPRNNQRFNCGELGSPLTSDQSSTSVIFSPLAPPNLIQSETSPMQSLSPPPTPASPDSSFTCQTATEVKDHPIVTAAESKLPLTLSTVSLPTPQLGSITPYNHGGFFSPVCQRSSVYTFPLFGGR